MKITAVRIQTIEMPAKLRLYSCTWCRRIGACPRIPTHVARGWLVNDSKCTLGIGMKGVQYWEWEIQRPGGDACTFPGARNFLRHRTTNKFLGCEVHMCRDCAQSAYNVTRLSTASYSRPILCRPRRKFKQSAFEKHVVQHMYSIKHICSGHHNLKKTRNINEQQESCAIAKMTAQCAPYMGALKIFGTPWLCPLLLLPTSFMGFCSDSPHECAYKI